jgi:hypothetical protein
MLLELLVSAFSAQVKCLGLVEKTTGANLSALAGAQNLVKFLKLVVAMVCWREPLRVNRIATEYADLDCRLLLWGNLSTKTVDMDLEPNNLLWDYWSMMVCPEGAP